MRVFFVCLFVLLCETKSTNQQRQQIKKIKQKTDVIRRKEKGTATLTENQYYTTNEQQEKKTKTGTPLRHSTTIVKRKRKTKMRETTEKQK